MKSKTTIIIAIALLIAAAGLVFKIYAYDSAKIKHCAMQTRQQFPDERGAPSDEWFEFYDECRDSLSISQTLALIFSKF